MEWGGKLSARDPLCLFLLPLALPVEWASLNYPKPRTTTAEWLHKVIDRNVSTNIHTFTLLPRITTVYFSETVVRMGLKFAVRMGLKSAT